METKGKVTALAAATIASVGTTVRAQSIDWTADQSQDSGALLSNAQMTTGPVGSSLVSITGFQGNSASSPGNDWDTYIIRITDPANFSARQVVMPGNVGNFDGRLALFDYSNGLGIVFHDNTSTSLLAELTNQFTQNLQPGLYGISFGVPDNAPADANGNRIWNLLPLTGERQPDGPGAANPFTAMAGDNVVGFQGVYRIELTGAEPAQVPTPAGGAVLVAAGFAATTRRRRSR